MIIVYMTKCHVTLSVKSTCLFENRKRYCTCAVSRLKRKLPLLTTGQAKSVCTMQEAKLKLTILLPHR